MNRNLLLRAAVFAIMLMLFTGSNVFAVEAWHECKVVQAGVNELGTVTLRLMKIKTSVTKSCVVAGESGKTVLAIALTAMSNGLTVQVFCDWNIAPPVIKEFHMNDTAAP